MLYSGLSRRRFAQATACAAAAARPSDPSPAAASSRTLADWQTWPIPNCTVNGATAERRADGWLAVRTRPGPGRAGILLQPLERPWDLEAFAEVAVPVRNLGAENVRVILRVDDGGTRTLAGAQARGLVFEALVPPASDPFWLVVPLGDRKPSPLAEKYVSMTAPPPEFVRRGQVDGAAVAAVSLFVPDPKAEQSLAVGPVVARGIPAPLRDMPAARAFPFIDGFGQFIHRDWPRKIHNASELAARAREEEADLAAHPRPSGWDRFGGWAGGPRLEPTGFFRVEKVNGRWWMVDPEGRLFWSHGAVRCGTRVRVGGEYRGTPIVDREHYFQLPPRNSPLGAFYGTEPQSTRGYYLGRDNHEVYDFLEANLFRKFGAEWRKVYAARTQRRLGSWGLNTIANSSDPAVYLRRETPYTAIVYTAPMGRAEFRIEASGGAWGKLPDPFDPGWRRLAERTLRTELKDSLEDPWCLGFFADNELAWGDTCHVAEVTLASPRTQPAKQACIAELKRRYVGIAALNAAWSTEHADWEALLASTARPDRARPVVRGDLEALSGLVVDAYFRGCRDAVKAAAPRHLYLGCRFAGAANPLVMRTAARYCEIVSINRYSHSIADLAMPEGLDRPIVIGEYHFGALDSAPFGTALVRTANQADRATAYRVYVESALRNPAVAGAHWFQFYDQPTSGRFDGENYNAGLADICDTPYPEMVSACRAMGAALYRLRSQS